MESNITLVKDIINLTEQYDRIAKAKNRPQRPIPRFDNLQSLNTNLLKKYKISLHVDLQELQDIPVDAPVEDPVNPPVDAPVDVPTEEEEQVGEDPVDAPVDDPVDPPAEEEEQAGEPVDPGVDDPTE